MPPTKKSSDRSFWKLQTLPFVLLDQMPRELVEVRLERGRGQAWGFRLVGGRDEGLVCKVEKVGHAEI